MRIDAHNHASGRHFGFGFDNAELIKAADALAIDQLCCSILSDPRDATPEMFRLCNDDLLEVMREYPGRILGYCFVNPGWTREALAEIDRCVQDFGMIGIKLYNTYHADDPVVFPIAEKAIELGVPILHHAGYCIDHVKMGQPHLSHAGHLAELGRRYPEARIIVGHLGGGGDWEWQIKALRHVPSVYVDTSGSVVDEGLIEMAVRELGAKRLLFATDMTMCGGVGKLLGARISERARQRIFGLNMQQILAARRA